MSTMTGTLFTAITGSDDRYASYATRAAAVVLMTGLTAAAAQVSVPLPFTSVPLTLQPMVVLLGGLALGPRLGTAAQVLYLLLGIVGFPVFAAAPLPQGALRLIGPTGGYLLSYPFAAFAVGRLAERGFDRRYVTAVAAMLAGLCMIYAGGASMLAILARDRAAAEAIRTAVLVGIVPFVAADILKVLVAAAIMPSAWALLGRR